MKQHEDQGLFHFVGFNSTRGKQIEKKKEEKCNVHTFLF